MRHGEAVSNTKKIASSWPETFENPLTEKGVLMIEHSAEFLKKILHEQNRNLDIIIASDILRTQQTAGIMAKAFGLEVRSDARLREIDFGIKNGESIEGIDIHYQLEANQENHRESYEHVLKRVSEFLLDIDKQYEGKTILLVSHKFTLWVLEVWVNNIIVEGDMKTALLDQGIGLGQIKELN